MKKNTSVMAQIMIYENNGEIPKQIIECYIVLSWFVYTLVENYSFIDTTDSQ